MVLKRTDYMSFIKGGIRIEWEYIGEGWSGDYQPDNPDDEQLLRFTVSKSINGCFDQVDDASYCTAISVLTPKCILKDYLRMIYLEVKHDVKMNHSIKRVCENISWIGCGGKDAGEVSKKDERKSKILSDRQR